MSFNISRFQIENLFPSQFLQMDSTPGGPNRQRSNNEEAFPYQQQQQ